MNKDFCERCENYKDPNSDAFIIKIVNLNKIQIDGGLFLAIEVCEDCTSEIKGGLEEDGWKQL